MKESFTLLFSINLHRVAQHLCRFAALQLGHVGDDASVGGEQVLGGLQHLGGVFAGREEAGRALAHLDLMVDLLLQVAVLDRTHKNTIHIRSRQWRGHLRHKLEDTILLCFHTTKSLEVFLTCVSSFQNSCHKIEDTTRP